MSQFPGSPRLLKGALVSGLRAIVFQYNPESLVRTLTANAAATGGGENGGSDLLRLKGPPSESISLEIFLDATDQLEHGSKTATKLGVHAALAALETLLYPSSARMIANELLASIGLIEVIPPTPLLTLLVWGINRIAPVRVTSFSVTEEAFDPALNPIRARVQLDLQVLTYQDLGMASIGGALSLANHVKKEVLAVLAMIKTDSQLVKGGG